MADRYVIFMEGLPDLAPSQIDKQIRDVARMTINQTADRTRVRAADEMRKQVNFPGAYLRGENSRLTVSQKASSANLEAVITGRQRPTSLARFVVGKSKRGLIVSVKPGKAVTLDNAFLMPLRAGDSGPNSNMGLAVRTARGQRPRNAYHPVQLSPHLWLLYGPSVDQVFKTVRDDVQPDAESFMVETFSRLFDLKLGA